MQRRSAGILLYRNHDWGQTPIVMLGHMGGPYWARKDEGAWSIPKGEYLEGEAPVDVARREFLEETGMPVPDGALLDLGEVRQSGGKVVHAWAVEGDLDVAGVVSNTFELEWPPKSGRLQHFPEIDRAEWFDLDTAAKKMVKGQREFLTRLRAAITIGV